MIGNSFDKKSLGKRSALNAHAAFDEAGGGNMIFKDQCTTARPYLWEHKGEIPLCDSTMRK